MIQNGQLWYETISALVEQIEQSNGWAEVKDEISVILQDAHKTKKRYQSTIQRFTSSGGGHSAIADLMHEEIPNFESNIERNSSSLPVPARYYRLCMWIIGHESKWLPVCGSDDDVGILQFTEGTAQGYPEYFKKVNQKWLEDYIIDNFLENGRFDTPGSKKFFSWSLDNWTLSEKSIQDIKKSMQKIGWFKTYKSSVGLRIAIATYIRKHKQVRSDLQDIDSRFDNKASVQAFFEKQANYIESCTKNNELYPKLTRVLGEEKIHDIIWLSALQSHNSGSSVKSTINKYGQLLGKKKKYNNLSSRELFQEVMKVSNHNNKTYLADTLKNQIILALCRWNCLDKPIGEVQTEVFSSWRLGAAAVLWGIWSAYVAKNLQVSRRTFIKTTAISTTSIALVAHGLWWTYKSIERPYLG